VVIKTILNKCHKLKSFVYIRAGFEKVNGQEALVVDIAPRKNGVAICSRCLRPAPLYDHLEVRLFAFVPLWGFPVYLRYQMRRVECGPCGAVVVEWIPWAEGKERLTKMFQYFLARWAKKLSWKDTAAAFQTSWESVFRSVKSVVEYGLQHRSLDNIEAIGVDEIQRGKGHVYFTLVYQLEEGKKRLLYLGQGRTVKTFLRFFRELGPERLKSIRYVCSDMWKAYLKVIKKKLPEATHILDRFHIVQHLNQALDKIRSAEANGMRKDGYEQILKHAKYCFLKRPENLTLKQKLKLKEVVQYDLKSVRAYLLKESFQLFWKYTHPAWAEWYLHKWCARAMRSRLEPIKKFVGMIRNHQGLMMNWFKAKKLYSSGTVEGLNRKINLVTRKSYGFRTDEALKIALFHTLGQLPEPEMTHRFC
jgi:transposase